MGIVSDHSEKLIARAMETRSDGDVVAATQALHDDVSRESCKDPLKPKEALLGVFEVANRLCELEREFPGKVPPPKGS